VPWSRIYVVTDPSLAAAVQRASKALSFTPLVPDITKRVLGLDAKTVAQVRQNLDPEPGDPRGFLADMHDMVYGYLGPGEPLNELGLRATAELAQRVDEYAAHLAAAGDAGEVVELLPWVRHHVTVGTARFLYGARNPVAAHPELEASFWDFVHGLGPLLMGVAPSLTARKPYRAREALVAAFVEYIEAGHQAGASGIVQKRIAIAQRYGWASEPTARSELSFLFAGIINTAVATFWVVLRLFADPALLAAVRAELDDPAVVAAEPDSSCRTLSVEAVRARAPTLAAVFRECLRVGSDNFSTRLVQRDTLLADAHLLRAGSVVQVAGGVIHADDALWGGPGAAAFDHARFLRSTSSSSSSGRGLAAAAQQQQQQHPAAFRAFGGGKTLCPGRHFATVEILVFAAMIVLTLDIEAKDGGRIVVPPKNDKVLPVHILEPSAKDSPWVRMKLRGGEKPLPFRIVA